MNQQKTNPNAKDPIRSVRSGMWALVLGLGLGGLSISATDASAKAAQNDYRPAYASSTDQLIQPCFGALINAKICGGKTFRARGHHYGYGRLKSSASINCDRASPSQIEAAISRVRGGGAIKLSGKRCRISANLSRSVVLTGTGSGAEATAIVARDGESCVRINPSAQKVFIQNLVLISSRGGQASCIHSANAELTLKNVSVRYEGDGAAVSVSGGRLNLINSNIVARTRAVALAVSEIVMFAESSVIASTSSGMIGSLNGDSSLQGMTFLNLGDWRGFERGEGARALEIKLSSTESILNMDDMRISDFADAIHLSGGGEALLSRTHIEGATHGIVTELKRARLINNIVEANEIGISVFGGTAFVGYNKVAMVRTAGLLVEDNGQVRAVDNKIEADRDGCETLKWGSLDPAQRTCTPWFKGSEFDTPADSDLPMFQGFWPNNMKLVASLETPSAPNPAPLSTAKQDPVGKP